MNWDNMMKFCKIYKYKQISWNKITLNSKAIQGNVRLKLTCLSTDQWNLPEQKEKYSGDDREFTHR